LNFPKQPYTLLQKEYTSRNYNSINIYKTQEISTRQFTIK